MLNKEKNPINMHLDLSSFKTAPCPNNSPHEIKKCTYYHFKSEKRRPLTQHVYSKTLCKRKNHCSNQHCSYAHNFIEQIYHPDNYKKKYCKDFIENGSCKFGVFCALAHSDLELKIKPLHLMTIDRDFLLFHFKSEFCPFSKIEHDRFKCVYAHNWQDYKRPFVNGLRPVPCKNWDKEKEIVVYEDGCPQGNDCDYCHGWKECEYHYLNFKKYDCKKNSQCERKEICSFKHNESELNEMINEDEEFFLPTKKTLVINSGVFLDYLQFIEVELPMDLQNRSVFGMDDELGDKTKHYDKIAEINKRKHLMKNSNREIKNPRKHPVREIFSARQLHINKNKFNQYPKPQMDFKVQREISPISAGNKSPIRNNMGLNDMNMKEDKINTLGDDDLEALEDLKERKIIDDVSANSGHLED